MGYRNLNSGSIRQQRRQQSRLSTQAPVGGSSVGHGSGLRFFDGGELIIDGLNTGMRFRVTEADGGQSTARMQFTYEDMSGVVNGPYLWSRADARVLALFGPLLNDSTASDWYGGSNLHLEGRRAILAAGTGGDSLAHINLTDEGRVLLEGLNTSLRLNADGGVGLSGLNASFFMNPNGSAGLVGIRSSLHLNSNNSLSLTNQHGHGLTVSDSGTTSIQASESIFLGTGEGGAGYNSHSDGSFYIGSSGNAIIQGEANGRLNMWAPAGAQINGDFSVAGEKNFIMDHPTKPGYTIKYASTESPVSGIEDRGRVTIGDDGTAQIVLPEHFTAIVKPGTEVDIYLQPYGPDPAWCDPPTHEGTTVYGEPGTVVTWRAFAQRIAKGFKVVEKGSIGAPPQPEEGGQ